ncbi:MAG: hypothetical protein A3H32_13800 [Betaproteobacteria bacterium RIFCSPLOWO2_02_FULL_63_19]|nr:MAG: hypothetical protein A3H32_13800 [Betaproteobacteria bacterium RIFCSPLOWO2_02_FULL_63_19]
MNWDRILRHSQIYNLLVRPHQPETGTIFLAQRRVYILPTRQGFTFALALVLMLIGSINYSLSLGYVLTFMLAGMGIVSILHTFRNLAHLYVSAGRVEPVFAGDTVRFELHLENRRDVPRHSVLLACAGSTTNCEVPPNRVETVTIPVKAARRGWLQLPRVTMETRFPMGLFRAWAYVRPDVRAIIYPKPDDALLPMPRLSHGTGDAMNAGTGTDDFSGLRAYQSGDSPRHIAWKAVARGEVLLTKVFAGRAAMEMWFDWNDLPPRLGTEARLSRLARWVLLAHANGLRFGVKLPGVEVPLGSSDDHRKACLQALALHDADNAAAA